MSLRTLTRSSTDQVLLGICAGIAEFFNISPLLVRILFIVTPVSLTVYIILAILVPKKLLY